MAKTIKFNLICDKNPVRTIEDLQNNFSVEDVLAYYHNKLLHRWLDVRGYQEELKKVSEINSEDDMEIIKELIKIFDMTVDENEIEEKIYMLRYMEERKELFNLYEAQNFKVKEITDDYTSGFEQLCDSLIEGHHVVDGDCETYDGLTLPEIKAAIEEMVTNYKYVLFKTRRELFWNLVALEDTLTIMCLLMNEETRKYYLPQLYEVKDSSGEIVKKSDIDKGFSRYDRDKDEMYNKILNIIGDKNFEKDMGENLRLFSGKTEGYWKDLEPKGKKFMIISMGLGDYVRSAGEMGGDMSFEDIKGSFKIVDGVDYKSNSSIHRLLYMEV